MTASLGVRYPSLPARRLMLILHLGLVCMQVLMMRCIRHQLWARSYARCTLGKHLLSKPADLPCHSSPIARPPPPPPSSHPDR